MDTIMMAAEGRTVLQEDGQPWPAEGKVPENTHYNRRRIADGDLVLKFEDASEPPPARPSKPKGE